MRKEGYYALYKGDRFIDLGTIKELSERLGMSTSTLWFYTSKAYKERSKQKNSNNLRIIIKIGDTDMKTLDLINVYLKQEIQKSKKEVDYLSDDYDANKINDSDPRFVRVMTQYALLKKIYKDIQEMEGFNDGI